MECREGNAPINKKGASWQRIAPTRQNLSHVADLVDTTSNLKWPVGTGKQELGFYRHE